MSSRVKIDPKRYEAKLAKHMNRQLDKAAIMLTNDVRKSFGNSGITGGKSGATKKEREANRSKPGEPPHVQTGTLRRNVWYGKAKGDKTGKLSRLVGTGIGNKQSVNYAMALEHGTGRMAARPYLAPALKRNEKQIKKTLYTPMR